MLVLIFSGMLFGPKMYLLDSWCVISRQKKHIYLDVPFEVNKRLVSEWVITPVYPIYDSRWTNPLTIDPNKPTETSGCRFAVFESWLFNDPY